MGRTALQEMFERKLNKLLRQSGAVIRVDEDRLNGVWKAQVVVSGLNCRLSFSELGHELVREPFADSLLAGHTPQSIATWYGIFGRAFQVLTESGTLATFYRYGQRPNIPCKSQYLTVGATYIHRARHEITQSVDGYLYHSEDEPEIHRSNHHNCKWFAPLNNPSKAVVSVLESTAFHAFDSLPTVRLIGAILGVAKANAKTLTLSNDAL